MFASETNIRGEPDSVWLILFNSHWVRSPLVNESRFLLFKVWKFSHFKFSIQNFLQMSLALKFQRLVQDDDPISSLRLLSFYDLPRFLLSTQVPLTCLWPEMRSYTCGRLNQSRLSFQTPRELVPASRLPSLDLFCAKGWALLLSDLLSGLLTRHSSVGLRWRNITSQR